MGDATEAAGAATLAAFPPFPEALYTRALGYVQSNDTKMLDRLWQQYGGQFVNGAFGEGGACLLHYAALKLKVKSVVWLLEKGAEVDCIDREGETPLFWCATISSFSARTTQLLQLLVNAGAQVNWQDFNGYVPLTHAVVRGAVDSTRRKRIATVLQFGADPRIRDFDDKQPLDYVGKQTNDGRTWTDALPENQRELDKCRVLLRDEMHRRDIRMILLVVRTRRRRAAADEAAMVEEEEKKKDGGGEEKAAKHAVGITEVPEIPEEVEARMMELEAEAMFMNCFNFI